MSRWKEKRHARDLKSLAFSPDGAVVASAADDALCLLWPAEGGEPSEAAARSRLAARLAPRVAPTAPRVCE